MKNSMMSKNVIDDIIANQEGQLRLIDEHIVAIIEQRVLSLMNDAIGQSRIGQFTFRLCEIHPDFWFFAGKEGSAVKFEESVKNQLEQQIRSIF